MAKNNKATFIATSDSNTVSKLTELGYEIVNENNGITTFYNDTTIKAKFSDLKHCTYTDKLCF